MLFKYSGKYVNIYFNMKITYLRYTQNKTLGAAGPVRYKTYVSKNFGRSF